MKLTTRIRSTLITLLLASAPALAQYTPVSGAHVQDGFGRDLVQGMICFSPYSASGILSPITPTGGSPTTGPFCSAIINGAFSMTAQVPDLSTASPSGLNYQMVVYNQTAQSLLTVNWLTNVSGSFWSFDSSLVIPISLSSTFASASGLGAPYPKCTAGASYTRTDGNPAASGWQCRVNNGYATWFQSGSQPAPGPGQAATIPVVAQMIADALAHGGGAANPGGVNTEYQRNVNDTSFGGTGAFQSISGNPAFAPGTTFTTSPFSFNGYNATNPIPGGGGAGGPDLFFHQLRCMQDAIVGGGLGSHTCLSVIDSNFEPGWNVGNPTQPVGGHNAGWTGVKTFAMQHGSYTPGIDQVISIVSYFNKVGDDALFYGYCFNKGGWIDASGEGHTCLKVNGGNSINIYGGASANAGTGLTTIHLDNNSTGDGLPLVGGYLENITGTPLAQGQITAVSTNLNPFSPGQITTTDTHPISQAFGNTTVDITIPVNEPTGSITTTTVHIAGGSNSSGLAMGSMIFFACDDFPDYVAPTAITAKDGSGNQTVTGAFHFSHFAQCPVFQGGPQGLIDLFADRQFYGGFPNFRTAYVSAGAVDSTHLSLRNYRNTLQDNIYPQFHNFGQTGGALLSRASNIVTACGVGFDFASAYVQVSAASDSSFNGGPFLATALDVNQCTSWTQGGANATGVTGTLATGGAVGGMNGTGAYAVWPMARILQAVPVSTTLNGVVTLTFQNTLNLYPNNMPVAVGDQIIGPDDPANKTIMLSADGVYFSPPTNGIQDHMLLGISGPGVTGQAFNGVRILNANPWGTYRGGTPGTTSHLPGANALRLEGPWATHFRSDAPLPGGEHDFVDTNDAAVAGSKYAGYFAHHFIAGDRVNGYSAFFDPVAYTMKVTMRDTINLCAYTLSSTGIDFTPCVAKVATQSPGTSNLTAASTAFVMAAIGSTVVLHTAFTTTAATSDAITLTGMTASGHCSLPGPTNAAAGTMIQNASPVYLSGYGTNTVTFNHVATAGATFDLICTPN